MRTASLRQPMYACGRWLPGRLPSVAPTMIPALSRVNQTRRLWQDAAKTTPAVADGDPVRVATCVFTGADFTSPSDAQRPVLHTDGAGHWWLAFDGVDDVLALAARVAGSPYTLAWSGRPTSLTGNPTAIGPETNTFAQYRLQSTGQQLLFQAGNGTGLVLGGGTVAAGQDHVWIATYSGTAIAYTLDGAADGGGAYTALGANSGPKSVGGRLDSTSEIWVGRIYGAVTATAVQPAANLARLAAYLKGLHP